MVRAWESLAGLNGPADRCTCSDAQLAHVGCDCDANQNLPVQCGCGQYLRTAEQIEAGDCGCRWDDPPDPREPDLMIGPEFADEISLEERWEHYAFEERNGMPYGSSF